MDLYSALLQKVSGTPAKIKETVIGEHWVFVVSRFAGMASTLKENRQSASDLSNQPLLLSNNSALKQAELLLSEHIPTAGIGLATLNSLLPIDRRRCRPLNAAEVIKTRGRQEQVAIIGHFSFVDNLRSQVKKLFIFEKNPQPGDLIETEIADILPNCAVVGITATTLINHTLEKILSLCHPNAFRLLIGPSTPMTEVLFDFGIDLLAGTHIYDWRAAVQSIRQSAQLKQFHGIELVTLQK